MVTGRYNFRNWVELGVLADTEKNLRQPVKECRLCNFLPVNGSSMVAMQASKIMGSTNTGCSCLTIPKPIGAMATGQFYHRYKNPNLYEYGHYVRRRGKRQIQWEDMFYDYASNFMTAMPASHSSWYSFNLVPEAMGTNTDDAAFATGTLTPTTPIPPNTTVTICQAWLITLDKNIGKLINKCSPKA